jgi:hypothetical protein
MTDMENNTPNEAAPERKKISLEEAIKQKLAAKKQQSTNQDNRFHTNQSSKGMKSQHTKKPNNQRKRTGV